MDVTALGECLASAAWDWMLGVSDRQAYGRLDASVRGGRYDKAESDKARFLHRVNLPFEQGGVLSVNLQLT